MEDLNRKNYNFFFLSNNTEKKDFLKKNYILVILVDSVNFKEITIVIVISLVNFPRFLATRFRFMKGIRRNEDPDRGV